MPTRNTNDWRANRRQVAAGSQRAQGALLLTIGAALLALFAWWLWPTSQSQTHLVKARVSASDSLVFAPLYYAAKDQESFGAALSPASTQASEVTLTLSEQLGRLQDDILEQAKNANPATDVLILDLCCHTVADNGRAYLLASQFSNNLTADGQRDSTGKVLLNDFLRDIAELPFQRKLVILDASRMPPDPWLGSLFDEFPWLAAAAVKEIDDQNLWLVTSVGPHQTSRVSHVLGRSLFGLALEQALAHPADSNKDSALTLKEFYVSLHDNSQAWTAGRQTPQCYRGGVGHCDADKIDDFVLARLAAKPADEATTPKETTPEETSEEQTAATHSRNTWPTLQLVANQTEKPAEKPVEEAAPAESRQEPLKPEPLSYVDSLWNLRDALAALPDGEEIEPTAVLPLDCAPQLWRRINLALVRLDQAVEAPTPDKFPPFLGTPSAAFEKFKERCQGTPLLGDASGKLKRLHDEQVGTLQKQAPWKRKNPIVLARRQMLQQFCRAIDRAPDYVRWCDLVSAEDVQARAALDSYLDELLAINSLLETQPDESPPPGSYRDLHSKLQALDHQEEQLYDSLTKQLAAGQKRLTEESLLGRWSYVAEQRLQDLLATPLLSAADRSKARNAIRLAREEFHEAKNREFTPLTHDSRPDGDAWEQTRQSALRHAQLVRLANPGRADEIEGLLKAPQASEAATREVFRKIGQLLQQHENELAEAARRVSGTASSGDFAANLQTRLADGRDASLTQAIAVGLPRPPYLSGDIPAFANLKLGKPYLAPSPQQPELLTATVTAGGDKLQSLEAILTFDNDLEVALLENEPSELKSGQAFHIPFDPSRQDEQSFQLSFAMSPQYAASSDVTSFQAKLEIRDPSRGVLSSKTIQIIPPGTRDFLLVAAQKTQWQGKIGWHEEQTETPGLHRIALEAFPNRENVYSFGVKNQSPLKKTIQVLIHRPPAQRIGDGALPGSVFEVKGTQLAPTYLAWLSKLKRQRGGDPPSSVIASTPELIELTGDSSTIHWLALAAGAPPGETAADKPDQPDAASKAPPKFPLPLATGLLFQIRDVTNGVENAKSTFHWVDFSPRRPSRYVAARLGFDKQEREAIVDVHLLEEPLPHNLAEQPVQVQWHKPRGSGSDLGEVTPLQVALKKPADKQQIHARPRQGSNPPVAFDVDGFPYAFRFDSLRGNDIPPNNSRRTVKITELRPIPQEAEKKESKDSGRTPAGDYLFGEKADLEAILEVEVPITWHGSPGDYVRLERVPKAKDGVTRPPQLAGNAYSPVSFQAELAKIATPVARGELTIQFQVSPLKMAAYSQTTVGDFNGQLQASLFWQGRLTGQPDAVSFAVDTQNPTWKSLRFSSSITAGDKSASLHVEWDDGFNGTGVDALQYFWDANGNRRSDADAGEKQLTARVPDSGAIRIDAKQLTPGVHHLVARLVDEVGNDSTWESADLKVDHKPQINRAKQKPMKTTPPKPEKRGLRVKLVSAYGKALSGDDAQRMKVTLNGGKPLTHKGGNTFEIKNLAPGNYDLKASGMHRNPYYEVAAEAKGVAAVPYAKLSGNAITLKLDRLKKDDQ